MAKNVVYLSGPMTGIDDYNYPLFNQVAAQVRALGHRCINPAEFYGGHGDRTRQEYMRKSVQAILNSTNVVLLPGWRDSKGATLEVAIATEIGLFIQEYKTEEDTTENPNEDQVIGVGAGDAEVPPVEPVEEQVDTVQEETPTEV